MCSSSGGKELNRLGLKFTALKQNPRRLTSSGFLRPRERWGDIMCKSSDRDDSIVSLCRLLLPTAMASLVAKVSLRRPPAPKLQLVNRQLRNMNRQMRRNRMAHLTQAATAHPSRPSGGLFLFCLKALAQVGCSFPPSYLSITRLPPRTRIPVFVPFFLYFGFLWLVFLVLKAWLGLGFFFRPSGSVSPPVSHSGGGGAFRARGRIIAR